MTLGKGRSGCHVIAGPLSGRSILVVEDEALVALDIGDALKQRGAQVIVTSSVKEALAHVEHGNISAAIIDRALRDGLCTPICEQLNAHAIPFLMHSGYGDLDVPCLSGVHFPKPASTSEMTDTIESFFGP
jgi:DNA-binding NtrC family response regulator